MNLDFIEDEVSEKDFQNPPKKFRPMVRWWWTGTDVDKEELIREVKELDEAGFLGGEIQCFMISCPIDLEKKDLERAKRSHRYMTPFYYEMLKAVLDEAEKRDMIFDITENSSWPAGGTHISKENSMQVLLFGQKVIKGPKKVQSKIPTFTKPLFYKITSLLSKFIGFNLMEYHPEDMKLIKVIAAKTIGKPNKIRYIRKKTGFLDLKNLVDVTNHVDRDKILRWTIPNGKWQIFAFYEGPSGGRPLGDSRSSIYKSSYVMDHFRNVPIKFHLDKHFGVAQQYFPNYFGKTFRAFFTDSLELSADWYWTTNFLEQFKKRRLYDLSPFLPICYVPNRDNKYLLVAIGMGVPCFDLKENLGKRIRYDYQKTISDLFCEEYVKTMKEWAKTHNLLSRIQAYGIAADTLKAYGLSDIPETEQLYAGGVLDFLHFAASAGAIYRKPIITAESMVWNTRDYYTTPQKWKVAADRLFVSGVNQMIYHGFPYQNPLFPYPGYHGFSTPYALRFMCFSENFCRNNPFWEFFPIMNKYITRCQNVLQRGIPVFKIGIYFPLFNYCDTKIKKEELVDGILDEFDTPLGFSFMRTKNPKKFDENEKWTSAHLEITDNLMQNGYAYVHLNEETILGSELINKKLKIGICELEVLIIHNLTEISIELAKKIKELAINGFPIVFINKIPDKQPGFLNWQENDLIIQKIINEDLQGKIHYMLENKEISNYIWKMLGIPPQIKFETPQDTIYFIERKTKGSKYYFIRHSKNVPIKINMEIYKDNLISDAIPFDLDPWSGNVVQLPQYNSSPLSISFDLWLDAYGSKIIELKKSKELEHLIISPYKAIRISDGKIQTLINDIGTYEFVSNSNIKQIITIKNGELPKPIRLQNWDFYSRVRQVDGSYYDLNIKIQDNTDWRSIKELKYCSNKGIYSTTANINSEYLSSQIELILDLKRVGDVAEVEVNGSKLPPLVCYPYQISITRYIHQGENLIKIMVTPTLRNQLVGYAKKDKKNFKNHKNRKLMASGLLGTCEIIPFKRVILI